MLKEWHHLPKGFEQSSAKTLLGLLGGSALIHLEGEKPERLFVSILLHGNEDSGLLAMQQLLQKYRSKKLPRALTLFVGNVLAAHKGLRRLPNQPDYNRCWPGSEEPECEETHMMTQVYERMSEEHLFASVDLHNNTGLNPHYACINVLEQPFFQLATLFSRTVVYFTRPRGVQSQAFSQLCPSVTLECGRVGQQRGIQHAFEFLDACLHMDHIAQHDVAAHDMDLFHTVAQVKIAPQVAFSFISHETAELHLSPQLDHLNFQELPAGSVFGHVSTELKQPLLAYDEKGNEISARYFKIEHGQLKLKRAMMPSMLTLNEKVIRQDCFCYLMERLDYSTKG
ncbi:MAG: M14 family metallopeptidase [Gammaproteobacteria bacterium]|nr:M14 family metallopeptidase [Gammaproteobacteria bacterium]